MSNRLISSIDPLSARSIAQGIRSGLFTSEAVVQESLERALSSEPVLQAWSYLQADVALEQARQRDSEPSRGPLHGVPIAIKDLSDTSDMDTSYGSPAYQGHRPRQDAACVAALRLAGAVIIGKAVTVEFGASRPARTTNPYNSLHTPGGSSSGSAAVVADAQVPLATGTQAGGSIIRPAAFCGVVGFKPSKGSISLAGTKSYAWSLDTLGGFGTSVEDVALLFDAFRGSFGRGDTSELVGAPRIGVMRGPFASMAGGPSTAALNAAVQSCSDAGARVTEIESPQRFEDSVAWQGTVSAYELGRSMLPELSAHKEDVLGPAILNEIHRGLSVADIDYASAKSSGMELARSIDDLFDSIDLLITFATPGEAPLGLHTTGDATFCKSWTLTGQPTLSLPTGLGPQGLPLAVQLVGRRHDDLRFLRRSVWVQHTISHNRKRVFQ